MAKKEITEADFFKEMESKFNTFFEPEKIKTGIIPLDLVLNGCLETGSLIELSGESQTGKSTLLMTLARSLCEQGEKVVYIDAEGSVKEDQMRGIGLLPYLSTKNNPNNNLLLIKSSGYNEVEEAISLCLKKGGYKLFIIDSLTALTADVYLDLDENRNSTENRVGLDALMNSRFLKKLNGLKSEYNCIFIFINQTRANIGGYVTTFESTGGQAVKFYPDVRLFMKLKEKLYEKRDIVIGQIESPIGANTTIEARKSRLGFGFVPYPMTVYFGKGISNLNACLSLLPNIKVTIDGKKVPALEKQSTVTYVLHLKKGDVKTSKGQAGVLPLISENYDEVEALVNEYLDEFYDSLKHGTDSEYEMSDVISKEVKQEEVNLDDTIQDDEV